MVASRLHDNTIDRDQTSSGDEKAHALSYVPYLTATTHRLNIYADIAEVETTRRLPKRPQSTTPIRGSITTFSRRSRFRMFKTMAKIRLAENEQLLFITVTYPDEVWFLRRCTPRHLQRDLEALCKRLERDFPDAGEIWRKEFVTRKSGAYKGEVAPHIHLVVRGTGMDEAAARTWLRSAWTEVIAAQNLDKPVVTDAQIARSRRHAYYYLSKYVAKLNDDPEDENSISEFFHNHAGEVGRHWGIRGAWRMDSSAKLPMTGAQLVHFKRLVRRWFRSRGKHRAADRLANYNPRHGLSVFGIGDEAGGLPAATAFRMWCHAGGLAGLF